MVKKKNLFYKVDKKKTNSILDLRHSTDGLFTHNTWDIPERLDDQHEEQQQKVIFYKPEQARQLLAEAAGEEPIVNTASTSKLKSSEIVQTVEEKLKSIFDLPNNEVLKGEWPCYIVQSAIVPGFMYLSTNHICFYASLPKGQVNKSLVI